MDNSHQVKFTIVKLFYFDCFLYWGIANHVMIAQFISSKINSIKRNMKMLMGGCIELGFISLFQSVTYPSCIICMCLLLYLFCAFTSYGLSSFSLVFHKFGVIVSLIRRISISEIGQACSNEVPKNDPHTLLPFFVSAVKWTD